MFEQFDEILDWVWATWADAARQRKHPLHTGVVANVENGVPQMRTVVLRGVDPVARSLRFHTDARAPKIEQLRAVPHLRWLFYDPLRRIQLTALAEARVWTSGPLFQRAWAETSLMSRRCYLSSAGPGSEAAQAEPGIPESLRERRPTHAESEPGAQRFAVVETLVREIDWLALTAGGNRRARLTWTTDRWTGQWLYP